MLKKTIVIDGMICNHCANEVKKALESFSMIKRATVHSDIGKAMVDARAELPREDIAKALKDIGYELVDIE